MDQIKALISNIPTRRRWAILAVAVLVAGLLFSFSYWQKERGFRPLYSALSPEDAGPVVQKLKESGVEYRLSSGGTTIMVPEGKVAELRLEMAGAGLPKAGRIGFEIFDKNNFGTTEFAEHVNYHRAIEGELERSVISLSEIEQARVHITPAKESVYLEARQPAKASVLVRLRAGATLRENSVAAITHLIASAVEGLTPEAVSVLDMRGNLLNRARPGNNGEMESTEAGLDYQRKVERDIAAKLSATLDPLLGQNKFRVAVNAECDMSSGEQSEENFDPTKSVMASSQKTEDSAGPGSTVGGIPGTASNLPRPAGRYAGDGNGTSRRTENVTYQTSRTTKHVRLPQGALKRLSVSVLIDHDVRFDGPKDKPTRVLVAPSPERIKTIHELVSVAAGIDEKRGDRLIVEALPFDSTQNLEPLAEPAASKKPKQTGWEDIVKDPKLLGGLAVVLLVILGLGTYMVRSSRRNKVISVDDALSLPAGSAEPADEYRSQVDTLPLMLGATSSGSARLESLTNHLKAIAEKDADLCVGVLKGWIREGRI